MTRFDLISARPLRSALAKSERSLFTYSIDLNSPFAEIENLINKGVTSEQLFGSFLCKAATEPTVAGRAKPPKPDLPTVPTSIGFGATQIMPRSQSAAHAQTVLAPRVSQTTTGLSGPKQWKPGHVKAAHDALAAHHLNEHYRLLSNKGPEIAKQSGHMQQHLQHSIASENLARQGVEATSNHHKDLREFYDVKGKPASYVHSGGPVESNVPALNLWAAHSSSTSLGGHGSQPGMRPTKSGTAPGLVGIPSKPSMSLKPQPSLGIPHPWEVSPEVTTGRHASAVTRGKPLKGATVADVPTQVDKSLLAINDLLRSITERAKTPEEAAHWRQEAARDFAAIKPVHIEEEKESYKEEKPSEDIHQQAAHHITNYHFHRQMGEASRSMIGVPGSSAGDNKSNSDRARLHEGRAVYHYNQAKELEKKGANPQPVHFNNIANKYETKRKRLVGNVSEHAGHRFFSSGSKETEARILGTYAKRTLSPSPSGYTTASIPKELPEHLSNVQARKSIQLLNEMASLA